MNEEPNVNLETTSEAPPAPMEAPPAPPADAPAPKSGGGKGPIIAIAVIAVVAIIVIAFMFMGGAQKTPEKAFDNFVDAMESDNMKEAYDMTVMSFDDNYDDMIAEMEADQADWEASEYYVETDTSIKVDKADKISKGDLSESDIAAVEVIVADIESEYGITVDDYCVMDYKVTITSTTTDGNETTNTQAAEMVCVEVDGKWYLAPDYDYESGGDTADATIEGKWNTVSAKVYDADGSLNQTATDSYPTDGWFEFNADGTATSSDGNATWSVSGDQLTISTDAMDMDFTYTISGTSLTLEVETYGMTIEMTLEKE